MERHAFQPVDSVGRDPLEIGLLPAAGVNEEQASLRVANPAGLFVERGRVAFHIGRRMERGIEVVHRHHDLHARRGDLPHQVQLGRFMAGQKLRGPLRMITSRYVVASGPIMRWSIFKGQCNSPAITTPCSPTSP